MAPGEPESDDITASTKLLGYAIVVNSIVWINLLWFEYFTGGDLDGCTSLTKFTLATGIILLLGRRAIAEIIIKIFGKVVTKE